MSAAQDDNSKGQSERGQGERAAAEAAAGEAAPLARIERVQLFLPLQAQAPSRSQPCETPARPDPQAPNPPATDPNARLVARLIALLEEVMDLTQSRRGSAMPTLIDSLTVEIFRSADDPGPNQTPDPTPGTRPPQG